MLKPKPNEIRKPTKTISGVTPVAVMLPPRKCKHGTCLYCPSLNVPQSYTPKSSVVMRASEVKYDSYKQIKARLKAFEVINHPIEKIEIIIMGGTFLEYPKNFQYKFIKGIYDLSPNLKIILSGSSSLELKSKFQESLTGRKRIFKLWPLSFSEILKYKKPNLFNLINQGKKVYRTMVGPNRI